MGSTTILVKELAEKGYTTKSWVSRSGKHHRGNPINKSTIYKILCSQIYIGKILHKGTVYEGEHEGIVSKETFEKARAISNNRKPNESPLRCKAAHYILRGIVFDEGGYALTCAAVKKKTKRYRYYRKWSKKLFARWRILSSFGMSCFRWSKSDW